MKHSAGPSAVLKIVVFPVCEERSEILELNDCPIPEAMAGKGACNWFRGPRCHALVVGLGPVRRLDLESVRRAAGTAAREAGKEPASQVEIDFSALFGLPDFPLRQDETAAAWVEGWLLGSYRFDHYKSVKQPVNDARLLFRGVDAQVSEHAVRTGEIRARGTMLARDWANEPPNVLNPVTLTRRIIERFETSPVDIQVFTGDKLQAEQMNGLIAVGRGSPHPPAMVELRYCSDPSLPLIALVGKGITYDTGGTNVKTAEHLSSMRMDMAGAAAVAGALEILAESGTAANVAALLALAENVPGGASMLPGELIRYANGLTVEVGNTDGEGRLVMADALIRASALGAAQIVDIATLTGSCAMALGPAMAGVWGTEELRETLCGIGRENGDRCWGMPLVDEYEAELKSAYADLCNVTRVPYARAITAALFLRRFVHPAAEWAHIDMIGPMEAGSDNGYLVEGATGFGTRLLADFVSRQNRTRFQTTDNGEVQDEKMVDEGSIDGSALRFGS